MVYQYSIAMVPPTGWREIDVDPEHREQVIERQLSQLRYVVPQWRKVYPALRCYLVGVYADAWKSGVRYAIATDVDPDDAIQVMATFMISMLPPASPTGNPDDDLDAMVESLTNEKEGSSRANPWNCRKFNFRTWGMPFKLYPLPRCRMRMAASPIGEWHH
ncbi:hypothetical protein JS530_03135 [Bifidobacterium sp. LC6]|uniref:Uncharacterized protein n=1 Tax=Bifidobacterium colobi TaxID=2809026 RepID=A0ABS5UUM8_9BIFI|nr:hypothetical protein [Bifidobacterium colobi]MBT1174512.1 hypothetical protein [Bifidobacterium colobi]